MFLTMFGRSVTSLTWCAWRLYKNGTWREYRDWNRPFGWNLCWAGLFPGLLWAVQPVSLKMGEPMMGALAYVGFAAVMGMAFLFGTLIGIFSGEWHNVGKKTRYLLAIGLFLLIVLAIIGGFAGSLYRSSQ